MAVPQKPSLNGRIIAEFYLSSEIVKRSTLRAYAKPPDDQKARILMYDPIRRIIPEYLAGTRDDAVLERCRLTLQNRHFDNPRFGQQFVKSNSAALAHLRDIDLAGRFENVTARRGAVTVGKLNVLSTADFYARYIPEGRSKEKTCCVIVYPAGIKKRAPVDQHLWAAIESEVAFRAANANGIDIEEVLYIDLPRQNIHRFKSPKARLWAEIDATCERIYRDWRDIRLEMGTAEEGSA